MNLIEGTVYRIICLPNPNIQYVGSTFNSLRQRWQGHKGDYKYFVKGNSESFMSLYPYYDKYGIENFKMVKIKSYFVCAENKKDHKHLSTYEQLWINKIKCVNKQSCFKIEWLYTKSQREYKAKYDKQRRNGAKRETILLKKKEYYKANKEAHNKYSIEYNKKNKEKIAKKNKIYCEVNRDKITEKNKEKTTCECGCIVLRWGLSRHRKTAKHKKLME